jgi:hypothetical protein
VKPDEGEQPIRAARKQALSREVNEQVWVLQQKWGTPVEVDFICECADETCSIAIQVASVDYERVRSNPRHFVVAPEHFFEAAEILVERGARRWVIEVSERGRPVAEAVDPRRGRD